MTRLYIEPCKLDKFIYQNKAFICDFVDGCLQDSTLWETDEGNVIAVYEHYLNCWSSDFLIEFARHNEPEEKAAIYSRWENFKYQADKEGA